MAIDTLETFAEFKKPGQSTDPSGNEDNKLRPGDNFVSVRINEATTRRGLSRTLDIREFFVTDEGQKQATKRGTSIPLSALSDLQDALANVEEFVEDMDTDEDAIEKMTTADEAAAIEPVTPKRRKATPAAKKSPAKKKAPARKKAS